MGDLFQPAVPLVIIIELKSKAKNRIYYNVDNYNPKSIRDLSNKSSNILKSSFEQQRGQRTYNPIELITLNSKEITEINKMALESSELSNEICNKKFISGNPANETTEGIIHYYKDEKYTMSGDRMNATQLLAMLSVPRKIGINEILQFIDSFMKKIIELKIVKDCTVNEYMILLKLSSPKDAVDFYENYNAVKFSSLESNICTIVFVSHVEFLSSSTMSPFPLTDITELPTCPVCLERLDEPLCGVLTIVCNHNFHTECIQKMNEATCPVCRYQQTPPVMSDKYQCCLCDKREDLWLCLICANIGCGRNDNKHAELHFEQTGHTFVMKIGNNLVWDYAADAHVHRLVANTSDGKVVEVDGEEPEDKKATNLCMEYTSLLADQLATQKAYLESEYCEQLSLKDIELKNKDIACREHEERCKVILREKLNIEKKFNQLQSKIQKIQDDFEQEKMLNKNLMDKQEMLNQILKTKNEQLDKTQDELRDLMLNLQMSSHIAEAQNRGELNEADISGATMTVSMAASTKSKKKKK